MADKPKSADPGSRRPVPAGRVALSFAWRKNTQWRGPKQCSKASARIRNEAVPFRRAKLHVSGSTALRPICDQNPGQVTSETLCFFGGASPEPDRPPRFPATRC
jgi:hypothetical protein